MMNGAAEQTETVLSAGFRIETTPSSIRVTADKTALSLPEKSTLNALKRAIPIVLSAVLSVDVLINAFDSGRFAPLIPLPAILALGYLSSQFRAKDDIVCTRESFQVIRKLRGKVVGESTFPKHLVGPIRFATFSASRTGSVCGLLFSVEGKKVKSLAGLEIVEADLILRNLDRLGYSVVRDVSMPMAIEMAKERRNSIFG